MPNYFLGIDPGLTHTGLALIDAQDRLLGVALVLVKPTNRVKANLGLKKKVDTTNYKLAIVFERVRQEITDMFTKNNISKDDVVVILEGFWYRPESSKNRKMANYIYETISGVAASKCALISLQIPYDDIMPVQVKRIISWLSDGMPSPELDKEDVEEKVKNVIGKEQVDSHIGEYAGGYHQHLCDAIAIALCAKNIDAYNNYMKIPLKKRKQMQEKKV
jgi:Holliday junction resolvasome RuvABC endonuclease subunit